MKTTTIEEIQKEIFDAMILGKGEIDSEEGCLSVPDKVGIFKRNQKVWVDYINENGLKKELAEGGFVSRVVQHEIDHLDGWCKVFELSDK